MNDNINIKTAVGSPAASHFLLRRQKKVTKEKASRSAKVCKKQPGITDDFPA